MNSLFNFNLHFCFCAFQSSVTSFNTYSLSHLDDKIETDLVKENFLNLLYFSEKYNKFNSSSFETHFSYPLKTFVKSFVNINTIKHNIRDPLGFLHNPKYPSQKGLLKTRTNLLGVLLDKQLRKAFSYILAYFRIIRRSLIYVWIGSVI